MNIPATALILSLIAAPSFAGPPSGPALAGQLARQSAQAARDILATQRQALHLAVQTVPLPAAASTPRIAGASEIPDMDPPALPGDTAAKQARELMR